MQPYVGDTVPAEVLRRIVDETYAGFGHRCVAPLKQLAPNLWLMELFHGPTLAFKDYAMQVLARLFDHVLGARGERVTIVGATRSEEHTSELQSLMRISYAVFCLKKKNQYYT